ncbi:hypothetical protein N7540_004844 [Penicillium herquei]|nr:hypothetical protein N7540_004844 [Penicillium herquei]
MLITLMPGFGCPTLKSQSEEDWNSPYSNKNDRPGTYLLVKFYHADLLQESQHRSLCKAQTENIKKIRGV